MEIKAKRIEELADSVRTGYSSLQNGNISADDYAEALGQALARASVPATKLESLKKMLHGQATTYLAKPLSAEQYDSLRRWVRGFVQSMIAYGQTA